jgi:hypothetical protein
MISIDRARQLIDCNLSLIPIGENKVPWIKWKEYQTTIVNKDKFTEYYHNDKTKGIGICTGYNNLEVIDIDLKVLKSLKDQQDFWAELTGFLRDNIDDFDSKFVIYKTVNNGYHILYRCIKNEGNLKIAKLKGQKEAIIESRGIGGYVFVYENLVSKNSYTEIQEISEEERNVLIGCCKYYNYVEDAVNTTITKHEYQESKITPWEDYNAKTSMFDIIGDEFKIVKTLSDKYIILRHGSKAAHSGYVYTNSNCMYLFTTGTNYPHEKLVTPFAAYSIRYHNSDFKAAAKELYNKGFGSRVIKEPKEIKEKPVLNKKDLIFPIDVFPIPIQNYIIECNKTLDSSIDYMGCAFLWMSSVIIGNSLEVQTKIGWKENCTIWLSLVGKAGIGKTPSISHIIQPLMKLNNREVKNFIKQNEKYLYYISLDKEERKNTEVIKKPIKTQFIVNDITLEALVDLHEESENAIGVFKDELAGWFKDMNKYRAGSDLEFWLSSWSGKSVSLNRKTAKSSFVEKPLIPVLGGIQPSILNIFYTEENKDNGFIDRMLLCYPDLVIERHNDNVMSLEMFEWYNSMIIEIYETVKNNLVKRNIDDEIEPQTVTFSAEANEEWKRIFNEITDIQNSPDENEYMKSMLPKQKSYIPRFALIINTIDGLFTGKGNLSKITKESMLKAEKLSKYFIAMAKKIKINTVEKAEISKVLELNSNKPIKEKFRILYKENPELNRTDVSETLGVTRNTIQRYIKEIEDGK